MAEIAGHPTKRKHKVIVRKRRGGQRDSAACEVKSADFVQHYLNMFARRQNGANGLRDFWRRQSGCSHLIEQRLKQVTVAPIYHCDISTGKGEALAKRQPAKAGTQHHHEHAISAACRWCSPGVSVHNGYWSGGGGGFFGRFVRPGRNRRTIAPNGLYGATLFSLMSELLLPLGLRLVKHYAVAIVLVSSENTWGSFPAKVAINTVGIHIPGPRNILWQTAFLSAMRFCPSFCVFHRGLQDWFDSSRCSSGKVHKSSLPNSGQQEPLPV